MLCLGNPVHLLIPSPSKKRILHPGVVIESSSTAFVGRFEEKLTPAVDSDVNAFCEINGKFFQQAAVVTELRTEAGNVIAFRRAGEPVSAESRQTYRVSVVGAGFTTKIEKLRTCPVLDISAEGFAAVVPDRLDLGSVVKIRLESDEPPIESQARVQTIKERPGGEFRYGFLVPRGNIVARKALQKISADMQRLQLRRLRGAA